MKNIFLFLFLFLFMCTEPKQKDISCSIPNDEIKPIFYYWCGSCHTNNTSNTYYSKHVPNNQKIHQIVLLNNGEWSYTFKDYEFHRNILDTISTSE